MIARLLMEDAVLALAACTSPVQTHAPEAPGGIAACHDIVCSMAMPAAFQVQFHDHQRAVIVLPASTGASGPEAETKKLRDQGARLISASPDAAQTARLAPAPHRSVINAPLAAPIAPAYSGIAAAGI
ncbi:MAG: hypothetical protein ACO33A_12860 [Hyphomonas sp.]